VHQQRPVVGVPLRQHALALQRHRGAALDRQVELQAVRGGVDGGRRVAGLLHHHRRDVARHVVVHEVGGLAGGLDADDGRQELVVDPDP
jgi:hypothetical protein